MNEIASGVYHWTAPHPNLGGAQVSSYYVDAVATVIDPMVPDEGLDFFAGRPLERVVLTNRHHYRHADRFAERFGTPVLVNDRGEHEVQGRPGVQTFAFGEPIAPEITAHAVEPSWPDEGALQIAIGPGILAVGDGVVHYGDELGFVPDEHLGAEPERVKELLRAGYGRLADLDFDVLLVAHGEPLARGGREALRAFAAGS